jgi:hypothetical protein
MNTFRVYPNPFLVADKQGTPCALCPRDPDQDAGGPGMYVGARPDKKNTQILQDFTAINAEKVGSRFAPMVARNEIRSPQQITRYEYMGIPSLDPELGQKLAAKDPIEIPATKYYRERLREGSIIPADIETSRAAKLLAFVPASEFFRRYVPPELPEAPGLEPLPQSPDAEGNLLEGPALPAGETREGVTLPADGAARAVDLGPGDSTPVLADPNDPDTRYATKKRNRSEA